MSEDSFEGKIRRVFFPYTNDKTTAVKDSNGRFVYYTTADVATSIINNQQIWMRNTMTMNDFMEVEYGLRCLSAAYNGDAGQKLNALLDSCFPGISKEIENHFNAWIPGIRRDTYITCISEHCPSEDSHGRLSMWRAYGGRTGVALVLNNTAMFCDTDILGAYTSPVAYMSEQEFIQEFYRTVASMENEIEYIKDLGRDRVKNITFNILRFAMLCTKHPGFHEEREWRVVASPAMHPSDFLIPNVEVIRGTPQTVLKLDLKNEPEHGLIGLALPELVDRIIIGPCEFPNVIYRAFHQLLTSAGIENAEEKIVVSDIPLRHM